MKFVYRTKPGEETPWWYGFAWADPVRNDVVCLPLGVNVAAAWARAAYLWVRFGFSMQSALSHLSVRAAYELGYKDGTRGTGRGK